VPSLALNAPEKCEDCYDFVCISEHSPKIGDFCWISGWGSISSQAGKTFMSNKLRDAGVNIFSRDYCIENTKYEKSSLAKKMFCAGVPHDNDKMASTPVNACQGDSGGPLMCLIDNLPVQFGLTSWGGHCEADVAAGVYADLSQF